MTAPQIKKLMLVDDSVVVRGLLRQIIEKEENLEIVATAMDGRNALRQYQNHRPDIVLMDIEMPSKEEKDDNEAGIKATLLLSDELKSDCPAIIIISHFSKDIVFKYDSCNIICVSIKNWNSRESKVLIFNEE